MLRLKLQTFGHLMAWVCSQAQSCLPLCNPMDCNPPGFSGPGGSPGKSTEMGFLVLLQRIFPTQGSNSGLPHCRLILYHLSRDLMQSQLSGKDPNAGKDLKAGGETVDWGRDGWMASSIQWAWVWASSTRGWRTGKPGVLQSMWSQRVRHDWATEQQNKVNVSNSCLTLYHPIDYSLPGSPYMEFSRQEYCSVAIPFSRGSSRPRDQTWVSCIAGWRGFRDQNIFLLDVGGRLKFCLLCIDYLWSCYYNHDLILPINQLFWGSKIEVFV